MIGHRAGALFCVVALVAASSATAAEKSAWNGVWVGTLGHSSKISVTIADDKVMAYSYRGAKVGVAYSKPKADTIAFGDGANYSMLLKRTGDSAAKGTYHGRHGFITANLTKQ